MLAPMVLSVHPMMAFPCSLVSLTCLFASLIVVASMGPRYVYKDMLDNLVSPITCVSMNHQNQLKQMANGAMFATISPFLLIYDNTSKASINLQKVTKLEALTLAWMLTIIQTPPRSNFLLLIFSSYVHT
jgi:hypothetical protein